MDTINPPETILVAKLAFLDCLTDKTQVGNVDLKKLESVCATHCSRVFDCPETIYSLKTLVDRVKWETNEALQDSERPKKESSSNPLEKEIAVVSELVGKQKAQLEKDYKDAFPTHSGKEDLEEKLELLGNEELLGDQDLFLFDDDRGPSPTSVMNQQG